MNKVIYKWNCKDWELNTQGNRYINIDKCTNEKVKSIIKSHSIAIDEKTEVARLNAYVEYACLDVIDRTAPIYCEELDTTFNNVYDYLMETDPKYNDLCSIVDEFDNGELTLELIDVTKEYYKFMYDNFDLFDEIERK